MPVSVMLRTLTSRELTEWRAYEKKNGPLDNAWRDEAQGTLIDITRVLLYLTSQAHFGQDSKGKSVQGPIDNPKEEYTRPWFVHYPPPEPSEEEIAEKNFEQIKRMDQVFQTREKEAEKG